MSAGNKGRYVCIDAKAGTYSHSIVAGGFELTS